MKTEPPALPVTDASFSEDWRQFASLGAVDIDSVNIQIIEFSGLPHSYVCRLGLRIFNLLLHRAEPKGRDN